MLNDFLKGIRYCTGGIQIFFRTPELWMYALIPLLIVLAFYLLSLLLIWYGFGLAVKILENWIRTFPSWISWSSAIIGFLVKTSILMLSIAAMLFTVSSVYEIFSGPFFDRLIKRYYQIYYGKNCTDPDWKNTLLYLRESICYSLTTLLLLILLGLAASLLPVAGPFLWIAVASYRSAVTFILPSGFLCGYRIKSQLGKMKSKRMIVIGFGFTAYMILICLPLVSIFLLPGILLGGAKLFAEETNPEDQ